MDARPPRRDVTHALVAGAGIGGAAAALCLANAGVHVTLCERVPEPRSVGGGILLQPNGLAVLYGLGLRDALRARAAVARAIDLADGHGRRIATTPVPDFGGGFDHVLVTRRSHLQTVLLDAVASHRRIRTRFGWEVVGASADGRVTVQGDGTVETVAAGVVVGADGVHSSLRKSGRFAATVTPGVEYLRGLVAPLGVEIMTEYWTALGIFGAGPVDDGLYFYASTAAPPLAAALAARDLDALRTAWSGACPIAARVLAGVARFDDLLVNRTTRIDCGRWFDGRLVLVGDAAHAMAPNVGQGANSALVDAAVLADSLATHDDVGAAFAAYEARRRRAVRRVQDAAALLGRLGELRASWLRWGRDNLARAMLGAKASERSIRIGQQEDPVWLERVTARRS
jgi:2-polyprenyl-6-methoxyphenol hydroxylase-like FAD-dependent oxidoreductase